MAVELSCRGRGTIVSHPLVTNLSEGLPRIAGGFALIFPGIAFDIVVEVVVKLQAELPGYADDVLLVGRFYQFVALAEPVVVLVSAIADQLAFESPERTYGKPVDGPCKAFGIAHFLVGAVVLAVVFHGFQPGRSQGRQVGIFCRRMLQRYVAQAGRGFRAVGRCTHNETERDLGIIECFHISVYLSAKVSRMDHNVFFDVIYRDKCFK